MDFIAEIDSRKGLRDSHSNRQGMDDGGLEDAHDKVQDGNGGGMNREDRTRKADR